MNADLPVVLLMGPTTSGKSALALRMAERLAAEIVSVDSAQVYRGMDVGTAKPSLEERARVPHHLIDILDPSEPYSAARFRQDALSLIAQIRARGRIPLLVGGTMLYFRALRAGLSELPSADAAVRGRIAAQAREHGWPALHARLASVDPETAASLHRNDSQRIQRALEIFELTGRPASRLREGSRPDALPGPAVRLILNPPLRATLHARIRERFLQMMGSGFLDEVRRLHARGDLSPELPSIRSVGYRQLWAHLEGHDSLEAAVEKGIAATRRLAKRQVTWLRSEAQPDVLDPEAPDVVEQSLARIRLRAAQVTAW